MRIAVLIAGEYREFAAAHKLWTFLNWENVDCYFSTWNTSKFLPKEGGSFVEHITENDIYKFINPVAINISDLDDPSYKKINYQGYLIDRWKSAISLMNNSGIHYDKVILLRPDLALDYNEDVFHNFIINISNDAHDILYAITGGHLNQPWPLDKVRRMSDMIYLGTQQSISRLLNIPMDIFDTTEIIDTHIYLADQFLMLYNEVRNMPIQWCIVRSNCRSLTDIDFQSARLKSKEWWELRMKVFTDMGLNHWGPDVSYVEPVQVVRLNPPNDAHSYNIWNKYRLHPFVESNTSHFWKSPDSKETFDKNKEDRKTKYITYGEFDIVYRYNSYGFRSNSTGPREFEDAYIYPTMLVSGCSITEGIGVPENFLWYNVLRQKIYSTVNIIDPMVTFNVGKGGISTAAAIRNIYVSIEHKGAKPDFVYLLLPPTHRKELLFSDKNNIGYIFDFIPGAAIGPWGKISHVIDFMQKNLNMRQEYHECYQNLLFLKYYLKSKNIPWFFTFWNGDLTTNVDYPLELEDHHIPVFMQCKDEFIDPEYKIYKENVARDCAHPGPNSHYRLSCKIFDKLLERKEFLELLEKWKNHGR